MDNETRRKLEELRPRVPRYLFRAWNNEPGTARRISGGFKGLNTVEAITPLYFFRGGVRKSVYDLTREQFTVMALDHLEGLKDGATELSSWGASLSVVINVIAQDKLGAGRNSTSLDSVHISIIDTEALWDSNQIFWVPSLDFLSPGSMDYAHEYLAHGVITGPAHCAVPFRVFWRAKPGLSLSFECPMYAGEREGEAIEEITSKVMEEARRIGDQYSDEFTLPVTLAVVCAKKRDMHLFQTEIKALEVVKQGLADLPIPQKWSHDAAIRPGAYHAVRFGDVEQFCRLMYALLQDSRESEKAKKSCGKTMSRRAGKRKRAAVMDGGDTVGDGKDQGKQGTSGEERMGKKRWDRELEMLKTDMTF